MAFLKQPRDPGLSQERSTGRHPKHSAKTGANFALGTAPAYLLFSWGLSVSLVLCLFRFGFGSWWGEGGRDCDFCPDCTSLGCQHSVWSLEPVALCALEGLGGQMFCLVAQAEFRVPAAADLKTELSFPRQNKGSVAGSVQAPPKPQEPLPTTLQSSTCGTSGQARVKKEVKQDLLMGLARPPPSAEWPAGWAEIGIRESCWVSLCLNLVALEEWGTTRDTPDFSPWCQLYFGGWYSTCDQTL